MNKNLFLLLTILSIGTVICSDKSDAEKRIEALKAKHETEKKTHTDKHIDALKKIEDAYFAETRELVTSHAKEIENKTTEEIEKLKVEHDKKMKALSDKRDKEIQKLENLKIDELKKLEATHVQEITPRNWKLFFKSCAYNSVGLPLKVLNHFKYLTDEKIGFKAVAAVTASWAIIGGLVYVVYNKIQEQRNKRQADQSIDDLMKKIIGDEETTKDQYPEEA